MPCCSKKKEKIKNSSVKLKASDYVGLPKNSSVKLKPVPTNVGLPKKTTLRSSQSINYHSKRHFFDGTVYTVIVEQCPIFQLMSVGLHCDETS